MNNIACSCIFSSTLLYLIIASIILFKFKKKIKYLFEDMDPIDKMVDCFETYLKNDLKKHKQKIKEIEHQLEIVKNMKRKNKKRFVSI